jgi:LCP family protein required for cell wall assembly
VLRKTLPVGLFILLLCSLVVVLKAAGLEQINQNSPPDINLIESTEKKNSLAKLQKPVNVLIVGLDTGRFPGGASREGVGRTDTIILACLNPQNQAVNLLSIPRDTLVEIPGHGEDKINHAHPFGGMPLVIKTVERFSGVKIDYYVKFNYRCYEEVVRTLGVVEVTVTEELHHKYYDFYPGKMKMGPEQAFIYLRLRNVPRGDIARTERQQRFCIDLVKEIKKPKNWARLPKIYQIINEKGETNIKLWDLLRIANTFKSINGSDISVNTVAGSNYKERGIYYWKPDMKKTAAQIKLLFDTDKQN